MNGASTASGAAGSIYPPGRNNSLHSSDGAGHTRRTHPTSDQGGALASAAQVLSQSLGSAGFVDLTASFNESFVRGLHRPAPADMEDLTPGMLEELMSWAKNKIAMSASAALAAQAHVAHEAAVKLLT